MHVTRYTRTDAFIARYSDYPKESKNSMFFHKSLYAFILAWADIRNCERIYVRQ